MDTPAYSLKMPEEVRAPFMFAVPHSGRLYPMDLRSRCRLPELLLRSSEDALVDELYDFVPDLGAPLLVANVARAYVDLNRAADELDFHLFDWTDNEPQQTFRRTHRVRAGLGVIPRFVSNSQSIYETLLHPDEIKQRLDWVYYPYHTALQSTLAKLKEQFGYAVLIDCHSMPSPEPVLSFRRPGPDVVLGDSWGSSADRGLTSRIESLFRQAGYSARRNLPYAGGYATTHYGKPHKSIHALQIELNRAIYMQEKTLEPRPGFKKLKDNLQRIVSALLEDAGGKAMAAE